jgi:hypothetical protein
LRPVAFVTGNRGKLEEVRRIWAAEPGGPPVELTAVALDLPEIQSLDLVEVLRAKAREASRITTSRLCSTRRLAFSITISAT